MREFLDAAADLLLGATCPGCLAPGRRWCPECQAMLATSPQPVERGLDVPLFAAANYRPVLERAIPRFKDDGAWHLRGPLAALLASAVAALGPPSSALLVPVPSLPRAVRARGYDHGLGLARGAAHRLGMRTARALVRDRPGEDQRGLGRGGRAANLASSMRCRLRAPAAIVLLDDVVTTGATLREAIRALRAAGAEVLGAAVIANADRSAICPPRTWGSE